MCPTALGRKEKKLYNVHIVQCRQLLRLGRWASYHRDRWRRARWDDHQGKVHVIYCVVGSWRFWWLFRDLVERYIHVCQNELLSYFRNTIWFFLKTNYLHRTIVVHRYTTMGAEPTQYSRTGLPSSVKEFSWAGSACPPSSLDLRFGRSLNTSCSKDTLLPLGLIGCRLLHWWRLSGTEILLIKVFQFLTIFQGEKWNAAQIWFLFLLEK